MITQDNFFVNFLRKPCRIGLPGVFMRNRNVAGYIAQWGGSASSLQAMEQKVRQATARVQGMEAAHIKEIEEVVRAAEAVAKAQEELERAKARLAHLEARRGKL
jgi:phage shock protein A